MIRKQRPNSETVATVILGTTSPAFSTREHLDENDLAQLELGSLCDTERLAIRRHLEACEECRQLVSALLRSCSMDSEVSRQQASQLIEKARSH